MEPHSSILKPEIPCLTEEGMVGMVSVNVIDNFLRNGALIRAAIHTEIVAKSVVLR
jgi:hypothetical protein